MNEKNFSVHHLIRSTRVLPLHPLLHKQADLVAQQVEHLTFNQVVLGSNPSEITHRHRCR